MRAEDMQVDDENTLLKLPAVLDLAAAEEFIAALRQHLQGEGGGDREREGLRPPTITRVSRNSGVWRVTSRRMRPSCTPLRAIEPMPS